MSSNLKVNSIVPATGSNVAIGTAGGTISYNASVSGVSTFTSGIVVSVGSTEALRTDSNSNIGIKTTSTSGFNGACDDVVISGSADVGLTFHSTSTTGTGSIAFTDAISSTTQGAINYFHNGDYMIFQTSASERMRIDSSGRVTKPNQPSFFAYKTGTDSTTNIGSIIIFDGTAHNQGSHYSTSTGKFTAPVTGVYAFHAQIWAKNGTSNARTQFFVNSGNVTQNGMNPASINLTDHSFQMSMVRSLASGDTVDIRVDTSNLTYYGGGGTSHTYFTGYLVG